MTFAEAATKRHGPEGKWGQLVSTPGDRLLLAVWIRGHRELDRGNVTDATIIRMSKLREELGEEAVRRATTIAPDLTLGSSYRRGLKRDARRRPVTLADLWEQASDRVESQVVS